MKKILKLFSLFVLFIAIFGLTETVKANSINRISMDIYVDINGAATVTEVWNCNIIQGTEVYHPYYNLGTSTIKNLSVSENGKRYQTLSNWSTSSSFEDKAYKCGINKISNGIELCWGISQYGSHTYTVTYNITNFVSDLTDSQIIYWTFIPKEFSNSIGSVYIRIHSDFNIKDTVDVWGYGNYGGPAYVYNGDIEMQSDGHLDINEYMTLLVKFPKGTFSTSNFINQNFEYYHNIAEKGAQRYENTPFEYAPIIAIFIMVICIFIVAYILKLKEKGIDTIIIKKEAAISKKEILYFRDIPCKENIFRAYYIGYCYKMLKNKTDILGALLLKWIKDSFITIEKREKDSLFEKNRDVIVIKKEKLNSIANPTERSLFKIISAASKDGILEKHEFEKWCNSHYGRILDWFKDLMKEEQAKLKYEHLIKAVDSKIFNVTIYKATPALKREALELAGLKKYLKEYTHIADREPVEVALFENYLIFAQLMGIAKDVAKNFKDIYPEIIEQSHFDNYNNIDFINYSMSHSYSSAQSAESRANSYSSGGGGFSSGGGGGGSFGGGGGGGGFR